MRMHRWVTILAAAAAMHVTSSSFAIAQGPPDSAATVTTLVPMTVNQSSTALDISVRGKGFSDKSKVRIDGTARSTTFVSETELRATLSTNDVSTAGSRSVTVFNPGGGNSNSIQLSIAAVSAVAPSPPPPPADNVRPIIEPVADLMLTAASASGAVATLVAPRATDNSGKVTVTVTPYAIGVPVTFPIGTNTATYRATDPSGNFTTVSQRIIVGPPPVAPPPADTQPPRFDVAFIPAYHVTATNPSGGIWTLVVPRATDNSGSVTVKATIGNVVVDAPYLFPVGTTPVVFTATDPSGNKATISQSIIVDPPRAPMTIQSLAPASGVPGAQDFRLRVLGGGFQSGMVVRWNGSNRPTTFSSSELTATITRTDLASAGTAHVTVFDPVSNLSSPAEDFVISTSAGGVPQITSVNPRTQTGSASNAFTIVGSGFIAGSIIRWRRVDNALQSVSGSDAYVTGTSGIVTHIPPPLWTQPGVYTIKVANPAGESNGIEFTVESTPSRATSLTLASAGFQKGIPGDNVAVAPVVSVRDQYDKPMAGVTVNFNVSSGGGAITPTSVVSDANGLARTTSWRLGPNPGPNSAVAAASGISSATFSATGEALVPVANSLQAVTPTSLTGSAGAAISQPPAVVVKDQKGNPMSGANVTFTVTSGFGAVSPQTQITGADGIARVTSWTLGPNVGVHQVKAFIMSTSLATTFTAKAPYTIVAFVKRADGTQVSGAQVCVGSRSVIDQYSTVKDAGSFGRQSFSVDAVTEYAITASKGGYTGRTMMLSPTGNSGAITLTLSPGSGGPVCPGAVTSVDATTSIPLPLTTTSPVAIPGTSPTYSVATPRFGEQILPLHGRGNGLLIKQPDCAVKGKKAVMGGLTGYSAMAVDMITVMCASLISVNELSSTGDGGFIGEKNLATFFNRTCDVNGDVGEAVVGISGTVMNGDIRSLAVHCQHLGSNGLASGPIRKLGSVGTVEGTSFGPDLCTNGRVARAIWATQANMTLNLPGSNLGIITPYNAKIVTGVKLICDDASRP